MAFVLSSSVGRVCSFTDMAEVDFSGGSLCLCWNCLPCDGHHYFVGCVGDSPGILGLRNTIVGNRNHLL